MNKVILLRIVNTILFLSGVTQIATGLAIFFRLFVSNASVFGLIGEIHEYNGLLFSALIVTHICLNWSWIKAQFRQ